jgi:hypothetical protein
MFDEFEKLDSAGRQQHLHLELWMRQNSEHDRENSLKVGKALPI